MESGLRFETTVRGQQSLKKYIVIVKKRSQKTCKNQQSSNESVKPIVTGNCIPIRRRQAQRLIPLTNSIISAMSEFSAASQSGMNETEKMFYNSISITSLVREEIQNIMREMSVSENFIRKEEIDDLVERCLKEKVSVMRDMDDDTTGATDSNDELQLTVETIERSHCDKSNLIVENFEILEQRINNLEERISTLLSTIPKLRQLQAKKFRINTEHIRTEIRNFMDKYQSQETRKDATETNSHETQWSVYDNVFYEQRERSMNLLYYQKSAATLELNERPQFNTNIAPARIDPAIIYRPRRPAMFVNEM